MESSIELLIVTVNYRTPRHVAACIDSLLADREALPDFRMIIIDNASGDDSVDAIRQHIASRQAQDHIELIAATENGGYAKGNNLAIRSALERGLEPRFIWFLNPDTRIHPGAGRALIDFLEQHEQAGMAGSRLEDEDGTPQISAFRFHNPISEFTGAFQLGLLDRVFQQRLVPMPLADHPFRADWLAGASMMMKARLIDDIGLMDESYFLYFEEVDYCHAAGRHGWQIWYVPDSRVYHAVGAATGISDHRKKAPRRPQYWFDSRRRFYLKNFGKAYALRCDLALLSGFALWRLRRFVQRKPDLDPPHFLGDLWNNSVLTKGFTIQ